MICLCGEELGIVTPWTNGRCETCNRSLWMQAAKLERPDSNKIAEQLNEIDAKHCLCGWTVKWRTNQTYKLYKSLPASQRKYVKKPFRSRQIKTVCYSRCGVQYNKSFGWIPILPARRQQWLDRVML